MAINNVASNLMEVVGTNRTLEQKIKKEISKILKNNPQTGTMN